MEHAGEYFDHNMDMAEARASANRRAREGGGNGHLCQVLVGGANFLL